MLRPIGTCLACLTVILAVVPGTPFAATVSLVADSSTSRLPAGCMFIFDRSDSLFINGALIPGPGSRFVVGSGYFDVSDLSFRTGDTLRAVFRPVPRWLQKSYGRPLPPVAEEHTSLPPPESYAPPGVTRSTGSDLRLTGAKSFRFNARSAGASDFGQSLDLSIAGELSPGIELSGSISDRGYDPSYGTADSRLSELDKINLMLKSPRLMAQVGDITLGRRGEAGKSVTGASFDLSYPVWGGRAAAARPKGVYRTFRGFGRDGFQGPYQIGDGSAAGPIVPGSETVWLDGARLERGADKDYTVDYPVGRVTFTALHPIDDRSRIEVDYEPQSTDFKKELLSAGAHAQLADSILYLDIETVREGDDRDNPETGELSATDLTVLKAVGDSAAYRSGVTPDTSGSYVVLVDSLPDTVYAYVGPEVGDLSVRFSFVGSGKGEYRYAGGDRYEFAGENNGEYLPIVLIAAPSRNDYHRALLGSSSPLLGKLTLDMRASSYDANLWSGIDDSDNDAVFYRLKAERHWTKQRATLRAERRVREYGFRARDRIDSADFRRDFFLPEDYSISADETVHRVEGLLTPISGLELKASYRDLSYDDSFESRTGGGGVTVRIGHAFDAGADWRSISSTLRPTSLSGKGSASIVSSFVRVSPLATWWLVGRLESDGRENEYADTPRGTRYLRTEAAVEGTRETVRWERFVEDSLIGEWAEVLTRDRLTAVTRRGFGQLTCDVTATYQWLDRPAGREETFLGRTDVRYRDSQRKLTVGSFYSVSEERRNARGITYLEVEPGLGSFILEDGAYVPDPDGNYIEVEELLSDVARVRRAERSFSLSKDWRLVMLRFSSSIEEELKEDGTREWWWIVPFLSDDSQPYLFFQRRQDAELRLFPARGFHVINLRLNDNTEIREIGGRAGTRRSTDARIQFREAVANTYFDQTVDRFVQDRDQYFASAGNVDGYRLGVGVRQVIAFGEVSTDAAFRRADSDQNERSETVSITLGTRLRPFGRGEFRASVELYRQDLHGVAGGASYLLTGNRPGDRGADWSSSLRYRVKDGLRINFSMSGRHSSDRTGRVTARGEVVATF